MGLVYGVFVFSFAVLICFFVFFIDVAGSGQGVSPAESAAPAAAPVASVKQIMDGIVAPSATVVFEAVGTIVDATGIHEKAPSTDAEWAALGASAAALVESANLLVIGNRAIDQQDWTKMSKALADAGMQVLKATEAKDPMGVLASGETLNASCDACHQRYSRE